MAKQRTGYEVINSLLRAGYCYRQLNECYGLSISTMHKMAGNKKHNESAATRELLNSKKPSEKPRWKMAK